MNRLSRIAAIGLPLFLAVGSLTAQTPPPNGSPQAPSHAPLHAKTKSCSETASTQTDLSQCAGQELKQAEARLAALLKRLGIDSNSPFICSIRRRSRCNSGASRRRMPRLRRARRSAA